MSSPSMPTMCRKGSVVVTAGGVTLKEGTDYSVDYNAGEVTILNRASLILEAAAVNVSWRAIPITGR